MVASFCKSHLNPIWIGSNFQAEPHCCSLLREGTPLGKMYRRLLVASRAPEDAPGQISFRGHRWPTSESTDVLGWRVEQGFAVCL